MAKSFVKKLSDNLLKVILSDKYKEELLKIAAYWCKRAFSV